MKLRNGFILLLVCWLSLSPVSCWAATYTLTEPEMQQLRQIMSESKQTLQVSVLSLTESQQELIRVSKELEESKLELAQVKQLLIKQSLALEQTQKDLDKCNSDLQTLRKSYQDQEKNLNKKITALKLENLFWMIATAGAGYMAVRK